MPDKPAKGYGDRATFIKAPDNGEKKISGNNCALPT
jgi:hypothetical protein